MKIITLKNPTDKDIINYPIEEAEFDQEENIVLDSEGKYKKTGRTLEWSIKSGETLKFPDYVAAYLKATYDFLDVVETPEETPVPTEAPPTEEKVEEPKIEVPVATSGMSAFCKTCGKSFTTLRGLALHKAFKHPGELTA